MIDILLVDDEPLMREALRTLLDWERYGFKIIGEAYNGMEALGVISRQHVDIVLTDIKMPVMDGLELIQKAKKYDNVTAFVVLSAYDEFHLVSNAYKIGAKDYILKSEMTEKQVIDVLQKVYHNTIDEKQQQKYIKEQEQNYKLFEKHHQAIYHKLLQEVIEGRFNERIQQDLIKLGLRYAGDQIAIMVIHMENNKADCSKEISSELAHRLLEDLENILNEYNMGNLLPGFTGEYALLFCFDSKEREKDINERISILYNNISKELEAKFGIIVSAGLSRIEKGLSSAGELYQQALFACRNSFIQRKGKLIYYTYLVTQINKYVFNGEQKLLKLKKLLKSMEAKKIREGLDSITIHVEVASQEMIDDIKWVFERYYTYICEYAADYFLDQNIAPVLEEYDKNLRDKGDLKQLNIWIKDVLMAVASSIENGNWIINRARNYIHKNYYNKISLSIVAKEIGVNSSYLSRVFAKEVGCSFIDYLTKVRLTVALEYMKNTNMKIYEVAEKVGYNNAEHFSRVFKKVFGKSPKEYLR